MFIQRKEELKLLNSSYEKANSSLDFVFGATNSGKTALLNEFSKNKNKLYISSYEMTSTLFFTKLANIINNFFENKDLNIKFRSFEEVLEFLYNQDISNKLIVILDDFQNILKIDKDAITKLIKFWKKSLKNKNIHLIVSSSIVFSQIIKRDIKNSISSIINLEFLDFTAIKELFPSMNKLDQLYVYSILGTTPSNLKYYNSKKNFSENIYNLFLSPNAYLFDYGIKILKTNIADIGTYSSILQAIALGNTKIGDIANFLDVKSTYLTRYIQKLIDTMIIKKIVPLGEDEKKTKYGRYEINDNTLKFWFSYIYPNIYKLQFSDVDDVSRAIEDEFIGKIVFLSYKKCIKEFIFKRQEEIFSYKPLYIGSWWNNTDTIDLIAYDNKTITFVQILWEDKDMAQISYGKLKSASEKFETSLEKKYILVTKNTFFNIK